MGWARYGNQNSNWRSHQSLENAFWLLGKVKTQKMHATLPCWDFFIFSSPFFLHGISLRHSKLHVCETIHVFGCYLFLPRLGDRFYWLSVVEFPSPHFCCIFPIVSKMEIIFLQCPVREKETHDFGCCWVRFGNIRAKTSLEIELLLGDYFTHLGNSFLFPKLFFFKPRNRIVLWVHILALVCIELGVEMGSDQLDKPSVWRNLTDRSRGMVFFFAYPEQHWKGIHSPRDCVAEKGDASLCWVGRCLESRVDLVQVPIALWRSSLA